MNDFALHLFSVDPQLIRKAVRAGVDGFVVDWENIGKENRQAGFDTQINQDTYEDLCAVRGCTDRLVICRINCYGDWTGAEVERAIQGGADEIMLPMVRKPEQVRDVMGMVRGRCGVGILIETVDALSCLEELGRFALTRVYVGLNDLAIERRSPSLFTAVLDDTVEKIRRYFSVPFGFAGLTLPECGEPIPCSLVMSELARLQCQFTFLRRSFLRDIRTRDMQVEIPRVKAAMRLAAQRSALEIARDHMELMDVIRKIRPVDDPT